MTKSFSPVFTKQFQSWIYPVDDNGFIIENSEPEIEITVRFNCGHQEATRRSSARLVRDLQELIKANVD